MDSVEMYAGERVKPSASCSHHGIEQFPSHRFVSLWCLTAYLGKLGPYLPIHAAHLNDFLFEFSTEIKIPKRFAYCTDKEGKLRRSYSTVVQHLVPSLRATDRERHLEDAPRRLPAAEGLLELWLNDP